MSDFKIVQLLNPIQINTNIHPTGVYSASTTYGVGDVVSYGNSSYIAIQATNGNVPTNATYWQLLASSATNKLTTTGRNNTGSTIPKGTVVYFSGSTGNLPIIALSQANTEISSTKTIGITATAISNNSNGEIVVFGLAESLDTSAFPSGVALWLSPAIAGGMTTVKPSAPNHMVFIGFCTRSHPTDGTIEVKVQNGFELEELHNVAISALSDAQVLHYESATQLWKNHTLAKSDVGLNNVPNVDATNPANIIQDTNHRFVIDAEKTTWNSKENAIIAGTTSQYYRGDKTFQTLDKNVVGLSNVDNTSDANKPVSTAQATAIGLRVDKAGDTMTGTLYNDVSFALKGGSTGHYVSLIGPTSLGSNTSLTLPDGSGTLLTTVTYAQVGNKDLNYNSVYTTASGFGYVQLDPSGSTGNSRARLIFNNTANNDYTFPNATGTVVLSSSLGSYVLKAGDSMTGPLEINGTSGNFSGVLVGNSDAAGTSQVTCGNGTTSIMSIGATNASFSNPLAGPNQGFLYSQNGFCSITNSTDGFNWVQNGSNVASIKNNLFTAASIDAVPVNFSGLTTNTATASDYVPFTNGSTNYKTSLNDMPVSAPQNLNSIVNALIFG
jgi:hypothetical protein